MFVWLWLKPGISPEEYVQGSCTWLDKVALLCKQSASIDLFRLSVILSLVRHHSCNRFFSEVTCMNYDLCFFSHEVKSFWYHHPRGCWRVTTFSSPFSPVLPISRCVEVSRCSHLSIWWHFRVNRRSDRGGRRELSFDCRSFVYVCAYMNHLVRS